MNNPSAIFAELKEIKYVTKISTPLEIFDINDFIKGNIASKGSFIIKSDKDEYAIS